MRQSVTDSSVEATVGVAPTHSGFADRRVATSPCGQTCKRHIVTRPIDEIETIVQTRLYFAMWPWLTDVMYHDLPYYNDVRRGGEVGKRATLKMS